MNTLDESFARLLGRQPTDREKQNLFRTRDALNLKNNDALWLLLMALGHHETMYRRFPALIADAAAKTLDKTKAAADAEFQAAAGRVQAELAKTVAKSAREIADRVASTRRWRWISTCIAATGVTFLLVGFWCYRTGERTGDAVGSTRGYAAAHDEKAAAAWGNTPEGRLAFGLAKAGSIHDLAACAGRGWMQKGGFCFPKAENGSVYGWRLPAEGPDHGSPARPRSSSYGATRNVRNLYRTKSP